ncbi:monovalent cation:proton antiporter family protein [Mesobacillus sp. AQ2]|uniref:monovalent cation:proton antiporter family protein n=1 Tax=unclassified Mesobacillus TaxID=2675270 RepID=UPI00203B5AD3|nr:MULTISPECIES: monovalent cation:proton antiporter family protein [unclassified Mesobacillus]MCM3124823.1 monovalent cation:proton antiporter family protein [Mesobacillus sp. MER 33]MCM3232868.1 monovalent cation:proton antiporter family protein [Mesobacillus sp. MER 48]WHX41954.1 monovalent cation:proton antiporter family protein [Mesobacillus sp. AQ2]
MEQHASITSLVIVIIVAFLTPIILHRLKLSFIPVVVAEIIMGLIIGKSGFNIVHEDAWLSTLSTLGFLFLMFLSGLEIDFTAFSGGKNKGRAKPNSKKEPNTFVVASVIFVGIFIASLGLSYLFVLAGFIENVFLMTLIISTISLGVVVPTLKDAHLMKTNIGQIILLVAVIADLATMILLAVFVSLYDTGGGNTWLLLVLFAAGVALYFIGRSFKNRTFINALSTGTTQIGTRAVFALIILLVAISETVGAENILGAFLAGVLVSLLAPDQEMVHKLDSFGYGFLIPIFFVMVGVELDLWSLFSEKKLLLLIPLLLLALFLSKMVPVYLLKKWYDTKTVLAAGFLLTSTLSLVIAAATIGERMEMISPQMSGTLILVAVISSVLTPILFKKLFPEEKAEEVKVKVAFIGANQMTLPVSRALQSSLYEPVIFHTKQDKAEKLADTVFEIIEIDNYDIDTLDKVEVYDANIIVISTGDPDLNATIAVSAKERGVERVIARIESPDLAEQAQEEGIEVFSVLRSTESLLRAMIESPGVMTILTHQENSLHEIRMLNDHFDGMTLRRFPFTGDVIFVRILRENESIVPHGDTELRLNDRLIVTGSKEYVDELKRELEFCFWC